MPRQVWPWRWRRMPSALAETGAGQVGCRITSKADEQGTERSCNDEHVGIGQLRVPQSPQRHSAILKKALHKNMKLES